MVRGEIQNHGGFTFSRADRLTKYRSCILNCLTTILYNHKFTCSSKEKLTEIHWVKRREWIGSLHESQRRTPRHSLGWGHDSTRYLTSAEYIESRFQHIFLRILEITFRRSPPHQIPSSQPFKHPNAPIQRIRQSQNRRPPPQTRRSKEEMHPQSQKHLCKTE